MPTALPLDSVLMRNRRRYLRIGALLAVLLAIPVVALLVLENVLASRCNTKVEAQGVLIEKTLWRIERKDCVGAKLPFYDVLIGLDGKVFASALTGRGEPRPVSVEVMGKDVAIIQLSGPLGEPGGPQTVSLRLRRSGTPKERVDLESLVSAKSRGGQP